MVQQVENLPATQETQEMWAQSLRREDPLEKEVALRSSIFAGRIPRTDEPSGLQPMGSQSWTQRSSSQHVWILGEDGYFINAPDFFSLLQLLP